MALTVYGLKNCDTCRKARKWLDSESKIHEFKDLRQDGFEDADVVRWLDHVGWDVLLNKRGTTWRGLSDAQKNATNAETVKDLLIAQPALMKRPIFDFEDRVVVGFTAKQQSEL